MDPTPPRWKPDANSLENSGGGRNEGAEDRLSAEKGWNPGDLNRVDGWHRACKRHCMELPTLKSLNFPRLNWPSPRLDLIGFGAPGPSKFLDRLANHRFPPRPATQIPLHNVTSLQH